MPGTQVVYHVGAHKTGTSLVQKYCRDNLAMLRRHRIGYVSRVAMNDLVGWGEVLREQPDLLADRLRRQTRNPWIRDLVVSHENTIGRPFVPRRGPTLYPAAPPTLRSLAAVLRPYRARVVISIRPQHEFLESYYLQTIQTGAHTTFADWLVKIDLDAISWRPLVTALEDVFGRDRVEIVDFGRIRRGQEAYLRDFFDLVRPGVRLPIEYAPTRNASISAKGLELALAANPHLRSGPERKALRVFLQSRFSNLDHPRPTLLSDAQREWLRERYDGEYAQLVGGDVPAGHSASGR